MKIRGVFLLLAFLGIFASFKSLTYAAKAAKPQKIVRYHVVITDKCKNDFSNRLLGAVKEAVNGKVFVLTQKNGVTLKDTAERENMALIENHACLKMFTDPIKPVPGDEKLTLRFNPPDTHGVYSADFLHFVYNRDGTWERGYNPGNYRYERELSDLVRLRDRIVRSLTGLPFK